MDRRARHVMQPCLFHERQILTLPPDVMAALDIVEIKNLMELEAAAAGFRRVPFIVNQ
jgi:hypothetical protein